MRTKTNGSGHRGITLIEIMVVICVLFVLVVLFLPFHHTDKPRAGRIACVNNLKQVGIGFRIWANDNEDMYPSFTNSTEVIPAWRYFQEVGPEFGGRPKILLCPTDNERPKVKPALDFEIPAGTNSFAHFLHQNSALSYFYGLDANEMKPTMLLAGDRNLTMPSAPSGPVWELGTNQAIEWTAAMHNRGGNVALADGSVQQVTSGKLRDLLRTTGDLTNRIVLPK